MWCFVSACHKLASKAEETNLPLELGDGGEATDYSLSLFI